MRIPLAVSLESRDGTLTKDAKVCNGVVEAKGESLVARKRPGLNDLNLIRAGVAQALGYWNGIRTVQDDYINIGSVGAATQWVRSDGTVTLSNGNLTAALGASANPAAVYANAGKSSGKFYWEVTADSATSEAYVIGIANFAGSTVHGILSDGQKVVAGSASAYSTAFTSSEKIGVALDMDAGTLVIYRGGSSAGTLVSGLSGTFYPCVVAASGTETPTITGNFGATAFDASVPSGYTSGISAAATDVVMTTTTALSPSEADLPFSMQDNGANAPNSLLMIKNRSQAWTVTSAGAVTAISDIDYPGTYSVTLTSLTRSGSTATATTATDTNFQAGSSVTIAGASQADYNGAKTILSVTASATASEKKVAITITRSGTTATATTVSEPHGFANGASVGIAGADQAEYNGDKTITYISATSFSFTVTVTNNVTTPATGTPAFSMIGIQGEAVNFTGGMLSPSPLISADYNNFRFSTYGQPHGLSNAASVTMEPFGTVTVANATATTFEFAASGFTNAVLQPGIVYRAAFPTISSITAANGIATVTTSAAHTLSPAHLITISGATQTEYNRFVYQAITIINSTSFSYSLAAAASPSTPATGTITVGDPSTTARGASFTFTVDSGAVTPATGTITATGGRNTVPGIVYMDGFFFVMDVNGVIYNCAEDDPATWNALEYTPALSETGAGKAIARVQNYVIALKEWSTEPFYNAANDVGSPLSPVPNGFTQVGCATGFSVAELDGNLLWLGQSRQRGRGVYMMSGLHVGKVSTEDVDRVLNADALTTVHAYGLRLDGHSLYVLTLVASDITLVYDATSKHWGQWTSLTLGSSKSVSSITRSGTTATVTTSTAHGLSDGDPVKIAGATQSEYNGIFQIAYVSTTVFTIEVSGSPATPATGTILAYPYTETYFKFTKYANCNGQDLLLHESDGHVYELDPDIKQDAGIPINRFFRTVRLDGGANNNKKLPRITLIGDKASDTAMIRWSDDDSTTFSAYRRVDLSDTEPQLRRCGAFRRRSIEFRHIGNTNPRIDGLELEVG